MEMTGVVIAILPERSGTSQRGEWKTQSYVIETQEQYPKHLCFEVFGADRIAQFNIQGGETITVSFDIDARQWQDKWYNSIKAWNVVRPGQQQPPQNGYQQGGQQGGWNNPAAGAQAAQQAQQQAMANAVPNGQPAPPNAQGQSDDLPF